MIRTVSTFLIVLFSFSAATRSVSPPMKAGGLRSVTTRVSKISTEISVPFITTPHSLTPYEIEGVFQLRSGSLSFTSSIYLSFSPQSAPASIQISESESSDVSFVEIQSFSIGDTDRSDPSHSIELPVSLNVPEYANEYWVSPKIVLSSALISDAVNSFMIVPSTTEKNGGQLIMNPANPYDHVLDGSDIFFAHLRSHSNYAVACDIEVTTREGRPSRTRSGGDLLPVAILDPSSSSTGLPSATLDEFIGLLRAHGTVNDEGIFEVEGANGISTLPALLPEINFSIQIGNMESSLPLVLTHERYLEVTGHPSRFKLLVHEDGDNQILLGHNILDEIAILFDATNRRIGFGLPK